MSIFICQTCNHVEFNAKPDQCPVCFTKQFTQNDKVFEESMEKSKEGAVKHIPQITINKDCKIIPEESCTDVIIRIGETLHPATPEHFIQFIDCYVDQKYATRIMLSPDVFPSAVVHLKSTGSKVTVVEFCNLHGHWTAESAL